MKRGKDGDKVTEPMFPRLSVNDADKGGPRAPPRNKMALYEQLCTPSQRFCGGGRYSLSHGMKPSNSMPLVSSKQVSGYGNNQYTPLHVPPSMPMAQSERPENRSNRDINANSSQQAELEQRQNVGEGDEDEYTVPTYLRSDTYVHAPSRGNSRSAKTGSRPVYSDNLTQNMSSTRVNMDHNIPSMSNRDDQRNHAHMRPKERLTARSYSVKYDASMESRKMTDRHTKPAGGASPRGFHDVLPQGSHRSRASNPSMQQTYGTTLLEKGASNDATIEEFSRDVNHRDVYKQRGVCNSGVNHNIPRPPAMDNKYPGHQRGDPVLIENTENCDDMSETSMVDSMSGLDITPDDVVGFIGYKPFLKARKVIANQQRVFSVQVFELHRLIQVQRLIAGSPRIMVDDNAYIGKALKEPPATKVLVPQLEYAKKPQVHSVKPKNHSEKPNKDAECTAENAVKTDGRAGSQLHNYGPFSGNVPPAPSSSDPRSGPWCFPQPSGHQWLVPVMSPSEGLIYKPYPGPGFMGPASGGLGPMGAMPDPAAPFAHGGFMNPPYGGFPTPYFPPYIPHPQGAGAPPGQNYFPPFSMPSGNPALSSSAVDQMHHQFPGPGFPGQPVQSVSGASNPNQLPNQSSLKLQKQPSEAASQARKIHQPTKNVLQGSTASSPLQRPKPRKGVTPLEGTPSIETRNPISLFPTTPATTDAASSPPAPPSRNISDMPKVIKVVPHNARSATESAARIFQSIQQERKHQDTY